MEVEVHRLGNINIIKDYIPHPNSIIDHNLFLLASQIECQIKGMTIPEKGPYISKLYGKLREEVYSDFEKTLIEYPENKRNDYIMKFYEHVDLKCQLLFEKEFNIREIYRQSMCQKEARRVSILNMDKENICLPRCPDTAEVLLKKDIEELNLDWHLLIEKTVDILIKCQLYGVKKGCIYRDISNRIKQQWWQEEKLSWKERLASNWNFSLRPLKQVFKKKANTKGEKMPYAEAMDCSDILVLITWAACGEIVTKFSKQIKRDDDNKELLANAKGFLLLVTQNLESLLKQLEVQFEKCLEPSNNKDLNEKQKGLDDLINELVNFREQVCVFESGFLSERSMFSRNQSSHTQLGLGSDLTNSMRMDRNRTDGDGKTKNKSSLKVARSRSFHDPSMGFDFP